MNTDLSTAQKLYDYCDFMWNGNDGEDDSRERGQALIIKEFNRNEEFRKLYAEVLRFHCEEQCIIEMLTGILWRVAEPRVQVYDGGVLETLQFLRQQESVYNAYRSSIICGIATMFRNSPTPIKYSTLRILDWQNKITFCEGILRVHWHEPVRPWVLATVLDLLDDMVLDLDKKRTRTIGSTIDVYHSKFNSYEPYESRYPNLAKFTKYYLENRIKL